MVSGAMRGTAARGRLWGRARPLATEVGLLLALFAFYKWGRTLVEHGPGQAMSNARWLWGFERGWLPNEVDLQHWALGWDHTAFLANVYYVGVHFPGTALLLVWLYVRHRSSYGRVVVRASRSPWRWVVALHAPVTVAVVVVTANHYWTDGIVAAVLLAGAMALVSAAGRLRRGEVRTAAPAFPAPGRPGAGPVKAARPAVDDRESAHRADAPSRDDELVPV